MQMLSLVIQGYQIIIIYAYGLGWVFCKIWLQEELFAMSLKETKRESFEMQILTKGVGYDKLLRG